VLKTAEADLTKAFQKTLQARKQGKEAAEIAEYWLCETAVRMQREGEGAAYTGLKPAGLDWGPVVPRAEKAIEKGNAEEVINFIALAVQEELEERFKRVMSKKEYDVNNVDAAREYVQAELGFVLFSHHLYTTITGGGEHGEEGKKEHEHQGFRNS